MFASEYCLAMQAMPHFDTYIDVSLTLGYWTFDPARTFAICASPAAKLQWYRHTSKAASRYANRRPGWQRILASAPRVAKRVPGQRGRGHVRASLLIRRGLPGEERRGIGLRRQIPLIDNELSGPSDSSAPRRSARSSFRIDSRRHSKTLCFTPSLSYSRLRSSPSTCTWVPFFRPAANSPSLPEARQRCHSFAVGVLPRALRGDQEYGEGRSHCCRTSSRRRRR